MSFDRFDEMVYDHNSKLVDVTIPMREVSYRGQGRIRVQEGTDFGILRAEGRLNKTGYRQLCSRLGAPHQWLTVGSNCPDDLEVTIIQRLQQDYSTPTLFRFREDTCRAVLSDKYLVYNHAEFWNNIKDSLAGTGMMIMKPKIWKPVVEDRMDAWILFEGVDADPNGNAPEMYDGGGFGGLKPAIHIRNTEDGTGRVRIDSGMFRSYCTNGVIFGWSGKAGMAAEHLGKSTTHMETKVALAIAEAAESCKLGIDKFIEALNVRIKEDAINRVVEEWSSVYNIDAECSDLWFQAITGSKTWADVVMATSDFAGTLSDRDLSTTLEEASGALLISGAPHRLRI
jgi:hypothetical protein